MLMKKTWIPILSRWLLLGSLALTTRAQTNLNFNSTSVSLAPVGETKAFRGTLRAKDPQYATLAIGTTHRIQFIVALDATSRLVKANRPATFADFQIGDQVEGFAFPDAFGRQVVAVASATARVHAPASGARNKSPHSRPHRPRSIGKKAPATVSNPMADPASNQSPSGASTRKKTPVPQRPKTDRSTTTKTTTPAQTAHPSKGSSVIRIHQR